MPNLDPSGNLPAESTPRTAAFDQWPARVSGFASLTIMFAAVAYSREFGFVLYAFLFALPHAVFVAARSSRKWQAWGWAIAWVTLAFALLLSAFTAIKMMHQARSSEMAMLAFLLTLLISQIAQLVFVRRAFPGTITFGRPLFRVVLYYVCVLLVVGATLPNWYVPPDVRRGNKPLDSLREDYSVIELYAATSKNVGSPVGFSAQNGEIINR